MSARKIRDEDDARACIAQMTKSRQPLAKWARSVGIDGRSLHAWVVNLARGRTVRPSRAPKTQAIRRARLVELVPFAPPNRSRRYTVHVGRLAVEVDEQFDETTLRRLILVLQSC